MINTISFPSQPTPTRYQPSAQKKESGPLKDAVRIAVVGPVVTLVVHPFDTFGQRYVKNANSPEKMPIFANPFAGAKYIIGLRTLSRTLVFGVQSAIQPTVVTTLAPVIQDKDRLEFATQFTAGLVAGGTEAILHPLNLLVTKVQVAKTNLKISPKMVKVFLTQGHPWKGVQYTGARDSISAATIFTCLHFFKTCIPEEMKGDIWCVPASGLLAGAMAGATTAYPAAIINQIASFNNMNVNLNAVLRAIPTRALSLALVVAGMSTGKEMINRLELKLA